jgi:hypothetical protein
MAPVCQKVLQLSKPNFLYVEGNDDKSFFTAFAKHLNLDNQIQVEQYGGTPKLSGALKVLNNHQDKNRLSSVVVIRDADGSADSAFQSVRTALQNSKWAVPKEPMVPVGDRPRVIVMILPVGKSCGMLEDVYLASVVADPAMQCVNSYFGCLDSVFHRMSNEPSKSVVRTFLTSREILEASHFEFVQQQMEKWPAAFPKNIAVQKVHAFLASRYKPDLSMGRAIEVACAKPNEGYCNFEHQAFAEIRDLLAKICSD